MGEWLKSVVLNSTIPQGVAGSNPALSAYIDQVLVMTVIAHAHLLPSMKTILDSVREVKFLPKSYSMIRACIQDFPEVEIIEPPMSFRAGGIIDMHREFLRTSLVRLRPDEGTILLDSGGLLTEVFDGLFPNVKRHSIQLTRYGCRKSMKDAIHFGADERKLAFDSVCAEAIVFEAVRRFDLNSRVAVCGKGSMGNAIAALLPGSIHLSGVEGECPEVDVFFGATGYDISRLAHLSRAAHLVSCSSWDIEFQGLLREKDEVLSFLDGDVEVRRGHVSIYNAGCPLNFNRKKELEAAEALLPMRRLVLEEIYNCRT